MERVLVAVDGSDPAERALTFALEEFTDARLRAVFVLEDLANYAASDSVPDPQEQAESEAADVFARAESLAADRGRDLETEAIVGHPAKAIVDYADDGGFDHVVVGSVGRTGVERLLVGSVAETVVRRSPVPVTVVR